MLKRLAGALLGALLTLMSSFAWGQEISEDLRQVQLAFEVSFFAHSAPELTLRADLKRAAWQAQLEATRSLQETPSLRLGLSQSLEQASWRARASARWEMDAPSSSSSYSVQLGLESRISFGQLALSVQFSPSGSTWTLQGWLKGPAWNLQIAQLQWQKDQWTLQGAELLWTLSQPLTVKVSFDSAKDLPLNLGLLWRFSPAEELSWLGQFIAAEEPSRWLWRKLELGLRSGPLSLGSSLSPSGSGWQEAWVEAEQPLRPDIDARGLVRWGPGGWLETQLAGRWHNLADSAQATLSLLPGSWRAQLEASKIDIGFNLQGKLGLGPAGIANGMLLGQALYEVALLNGVFNYTGSLWLLDLSGSVSSDVWELSGSSSWISSTGWDKGVLSLSRSWEFFEDR